MSPVPSSAVEPQLDLTRPTLAAFVVTAAVLIVVTNLICLVKLGAF